LARVDEDGIRMSDWVSERQRPPSRDHTSVSRFQIEGLVLTLSDDSTIALEFKAAASEVWIDSDISTDKKCPFTGQVSIRGRILTGKVVSTKMHRTLIIRREYLHFVPKYARYEKRHKNLAAHVSPAFRVEEGDTVTVGQCRPLSKTVRFTGHGECARTDRC